MQLYLELTAECTPGCEHSDTAKRNCRASKQPAANLDIAVVLFGAGEVVVYIYIFNNQSVVFCSKGT